MRNSFDEKAAIWDEDPRRIELVGKVWDLVADQINFQNIEKVLDYGCGTGLLGYKAINQVGSITFCDTSAGMLEQVKKKQEYFAYQHVEILQSDFTSDKLPAQKYDLILSMLALHHVTDITLLLKNFSVLLNAGGLFCWIDLDKEDGSFHNDNSVIPHFGFSKAEIEKLIKIAGFELLHYTTELFMQRETDNGPRNYPLFVAIMKKSSK